MSRNCAIAKIETYFDDGTFLTDLSRRVAIRTESSVPERRPELYRYLNEELIPYLEAM